MHTKYLSNPFRFENKWHFGWNSCLCFIASLALLTLYALVPELPPALVLSGITAAATFGMLSAMLSLAFDRFWLPKIYAACGLMGNLCVVLWILLSF